MADLTHPCAVGWCVALSTGAAAPCAVHARHGHYRPPAARRPGEAHPSLTRPALVDRPWDGPGRLDPPPTFRRPWDDAWAPSGQERLA